MLFAFASLALAGDLNVVTPPDAEVYVDRAVVPIAREGQHLARGLQPGMHEIEIRVGRQMVDNLWVEVPPTGRVRVEWARGEHGAVFSVFTPTAQRPEGPPTRPDGHRPDRPPRGPAPMAQRDFDALRRQVQDSSFDAGRMGLIESAIQHNHFVVDQVTELLRAFDFDSNRAEAACLLGQRVLDPQNATRIAPAFDFDRHRNQALSCIH